MTESPWPQQPAVVHRHDPAVCATCSPTVPSAVLRARKIAHTNVVSTTMRAMTSGRRRIADFGED
jgi:hypothetical protein